MLTNCLPVQFLYRFSCEMHIWVVPLHPYATIPCKINKKCELDLHESVHRDIITKVNNKLQLCRLIYYS
jgi:hypothetical protein